MRRRPIVGVIAVLTAAAAAAVTGLPEAPSGAEAAGPAATAEVTRETLVDEEEHDGTLGYGDTTSIGNRLTGTVTRLPATGATLRRGQALYRLDNRPVLLLYGTLPAYREMSPGMQGADVEQFEKNLWALGYRGFTVDDEYTGATADAVEQWQDDRGLPGTGRVELGRVAYRPGAVRVHALTAATGAVVAPGSEILQVTGTGRVAGVQLEIDDQRLARKGAAVTVTLPDGAPAAGRISAVETSVEQAESPAEDDRTVLTVTITFAKAPAGLDDAAVTVAFTAGRRADVLTVPVHALLALAEGGYGVQTADGRIVAVETGLFGGGRVEVSGGGLAEGQRVGVPA